MRIKEGVWNGKKFSVIGFFKMRIKFCWCKFKYCFEFNVLYNLLLLGRWNWEICKEGYWIFGEKILEEIWRVGFIDYGCDE